MADNRETTLLKEVNRSGFIFQLGIEEMIEAESRKDRHGWKVVGREHRWMDTTSGAEGYIDIVLQLDLWRMVIECKRLRGDVSWVFLVPEPAPLKHIPRARLLWTSRPGANIRNFIEWDDLSVIPPSSESAFCVIRGQNDRDKPMLENLSDRVLPSLESLAYEEFQLGEYREKDWRIYIPVIVTTAKLEVCMFDPSEVNIDTGILASGNFETVPFVRFRKGLATRLSAGKIPNNLEKANRDKERTIFVVQAANFIDFLSVFNISQPMHGKLWPWEDLIWQRLKKEPG